MRRPVIAGNWKMYKTIAEAIDFVQSLKPMVVGTTHCEIVLAPAFTALRPVADRLQGSNIRLSSQDVAAEPGTGAFTGEVSAAQVAEAGGTLAIVGHSERRQYYCETDETVNRKIGAAIDAGLTPIVCVGEGLEDRKADRATERVGGQIASSLHNLTVEHASRIIIAYEPVWAIGTGYTATPDVAEEMHAFIRSRIIGMFGETVGDSIRIIYGGSVKPDNISALMAQSDIDGALVGGASLEADSLARIINYRTS